ESCLFGGNGLDATRLQLEIPALYGEPGGLVVVSIREQDAEAFEKLCGGHVDVQLLRAGTVIEEKILRIGSLEWPLARLGEARNTIPHGDRLTGV
ncbi:MAG: hypothetical protein JJU11_17875, partial [Candidatus Sumerlaeia bacterium]|nr:hypothetical protein [Candidatus Sumerlaeia bacterium]